MQTKSFGALVSVHMVVLILWVVWFHCSKYPEQLSAANVCPTWVFISSHSVMRQKDRTIMMQS